VQHFKDAGRAHGVSPALLMAIASRESSMGEELVGDNGNAITLMQINGRFHEAFVRDHEPNDHRAGIFKGGDILSDELAHFGALRPGLASYNADRDTVQKALDQGVDVDTYTTGSYVDDVLQRWRWMKEMRPSLADPPRRVASSSTLAAAGLGVAGGIAYALYRSTTSTSK